MCAFSFTPAISRCHVLVVLLCSAHICQRPDVCLLSDSCDSIGTNSHPLAFFHTHALSLSTCFSAFVISHSHVQVSMGCISLRLVCAKLAKSAGIRAYATTAFTGPIDGYQQEAICAGVGM